MENRAAMIAEPKRAAREDCEVAFQGLTSAALTQAPSRSITASGSHFMGRGDVARSRRVQSMLRGGLDLARKSGTARRPLQMRIFRPSSKKETPREAELGGATK